MGQEEAPVYCIEHDKSIDDDGQVTTTTRELLRLPYVNVDAYQVQESFMKMVAPRLLEY